MKLIYFILGAISITMFIWGFPVSMLLADWLLVPMALISGFVSALCGPYFLSKAFEYPSYEERKARSRKENK